MNKKPIKSENELSYTDSEQIRAIVDQQLRQHHNIEYIEGLSLGAQKDSFYKTFFTGSRFILMLAVTAFITNRVDHYLADSYNVHKSQPSVAIADQQIQENLKREEGS